MRISLKELFAVVTFVSVVAWCLALVGFDNPLFWLAFAAMSVMSCVFVYLAGDKQRRRWILLAFAPTFLCLCSGVFSIAGFADVLLLLIAACFCSWGPPLSSKALCGIAMICMAIALVVGVVPGMYEGRHITALRQKFPIESLASRLQYEHRDEAKKMAENDIMSAEVAAQLGEFEQSLNTGGYIQLRLQTIHSRSYEQFVRAVGFGVGRMMPPPSLRMSDERQLQRIAFNDHRSEIAITDSWQWKAFANARQSADVKNLHTVSRADFLDPDSFGVLAPKSQVIGFVEHAFHYPPGDSLENRDHWTIDRIELVSLLRFDEPRVYVLDHLPRMDELAVEDVSTRDLDDFERSSLEQLRAEKDISVLWQGNNLRMMGSLRAATQCLDCHSVPRGALLGAFSYELHAH